MFWKKTYVLLLLAAMPGGLFSQDGNLIQNSSFEEPAGKNWKTPSWVWKSKDKDRYVDACIDETTSQGAVGTKSMRIDSEPGKSAWLPYAETHGNLPADLKEATLSVWTKTAGWEKGNKGRLEVMVTLHGKGKKSIMKGIITPWDKTLPDWTNYTIDFQIPDGYDTWSALIKFSGTKTTAGKVWIDNLYFGPKLKQAPVVKGEKIAELVRGVHVAPHGGIYYPGEPLVHEFHFRNIKEPGSKVTLTWRMNDFDGNTIASGTQETTLERKIQLSPVLPPDYRGYYILKLELTQNGKFVANGTFSGMIVDKQQERDPFFSTRGCSTYDKHVRMGFASRVMEPGSSIAWAIERQKGKYDWTMKDARLKNALDAGYTDLYAHTSFTNYACIPGYLKNEYDAKLKAGVDPYTAEDYENYRKFCRAAIERYGKYITSWRVPDEIMLTRYHNKFAQTQYYKFCRIFYEELKKQYPNTPLYAGGAFFGDEKYADLKRDVWDKIKDSVDGLCVDAYPHGIGVGVGQNYLGPEQIKLRERYLKTFDITGVKAFVNEETGSGIQRNLALDSNELREFAIINARMVIVCKSMNQVKGWTWFLVEDAKSAWNGNYDYAMWKEHNPRPHAATYALISRQLAFAQDGIEVKPHADIYSYVFKRKGKTLLTIWAFSKDLVDAKIDMPSDWTAVDLMGKHFSGKKGESSFKLNDRPYFIELSAPQKEVADAVAKGRYAMPQITLAMNRKDGSTMNVFVQNKTNSELEAEVSLNGSAVQKMKLPPLANVPVPFECKPGKAPLKAVAQVGKVKYELTRPEELFMVERLEQAPAMDGTLKGFENVTPIVFDKSDTLKPIDAAAWGYWTGPKDASAKIYLAYDKDYFYIAADVLDDIHITRASDQMIWNQDCLQYGFDTENDAFDIRAARGGYSPDDREFCMALTPKGPQNFCYTAPLALAGKTVPNLVNIKELPGGRMIYEARIPWSYFGKLGPKPGSVFGFNIVMFDIDQKDGAIPYYMELSPGIADGKNPAYFKRFMLK